MKLNRTPIIILGIFAITSCLGQVNNLVFFDFSSDSATKNTDTWIEHAKTLISDNYGSKYVHFLHGGKENYPLISKYDSQIDLSANMTLVKKSRPNAVGELKNILFELDAYEIDSDLTIAVVSSSDVFFDNHRLLYERLKLIFEQLGTRVNLVYHIPESELDYVQKLTLGTNLSTYQIKYFQ